MPKKNNTTLSETLKRFFVNKLSDNPPDHANVVKFVRPTAPDDLLLACKECAAYDFLITQAFNVRCARCGHLVINISNL